MQIWEEHVLDNNINNINFIVVIPLTSCVTLS